MLCSFVSDLVEVPKYYKILQLYFKVAACFVFIFLTAAERDGVHKVLSPVLLFAWYYTEVVSAKC